MRTFGIILVVLGVIGGIYSFNMSTYVETGGEFIGEGAFSTYIPRQSIHNLDLADQRRTYLMISGLLIITGTILFGFGSLQNSSRNIDASMNGSFISSGEKKCPDCAEIVRTDAAVCRYCRHQFATFTGESDKEMINENTPIGPESWKCEKCGEVHGSEFDSCWNCGAEKS